MRKFLYACLLAFLIVLCFPLALHGAEPAKHKKRSKRLSESAQIFKMFPELKGSKEVRAEASKFADDHNLKIVLDDEQIETLVETKELVEFPPKPWPFEVPHDPKHPKRNTPKNFYCMVLKPQIYLFDLAQRFKDHFESTPHPAKLKITSVIRTVKYFETNLSKRNINAVPDSAHFRGIAFDIGAANMTREQKFYLAQLLHNDFVAGRVRATYECRGQINFHVVVREI